MAAYRDLAEAFDRFAKEWESGRRPRLEAYLDSVDENSRSQLLRTLLRLELEMVRRSGAVLDIANYRRRFPQYVDVVDEVYGKFTSGGEKPVGSTVASGVTVAYEAMPGQAPESLGRFRLIALLGQGAFGSVFRACDPELEREVAIKVPRLSAGASEFDVQQFLREARAAATIQHPNVCPVYEAGVHEGRPYIVMAYIPGKSLAEVLQNRQPPPGRQVALIIRKLALALQAAHDKGVIHRDLKPSNILFDQNRKDVIVTDFGLARRDGLGDARQTKSGVVMGTPAYMSPEQARGDTRNVGPSADIYSLGVILYELLAGKRPFDGAVGEVIGKVQHVEPIPPTKVRAEADPHLESICRKAMAKNPADRFSSMRAFADAMGEYLKGNAPDPTPNFASPSAIASQETAGFADLIANALAEQKAEMAATLEAAVSKARIPLWKILLPMGLLAVFGLVMLGLYLFTKPVTVPITLQLDVDLKEKELSFFLDDKPIEAEKLAGPIEMTEGKHVLIVKRVETIIRRYEFEVKRGMDPYLKLEDTLAPPWPMGPGVPAASVHYSLDGQGQAILNDTRRRASAGQVHGTVESTKGIIGQAAGLNGNSRLEIHDHPALHYSGKLTAAAWVKGTNDKSTIVARTAPGGSAFRLGTDTANKLEPVENVVDRSLTRIITWTVHFSQGAKDDEAVTLKATYDPLQWTHVAGTFDGHFLRIYLNGYLAAETMLADDPTFRKLLDDGKVRLPATMASSMANLVMGDMFNGQIDDVMLFDSALAEKELRKIIHFHTHRQLATPPAQMMNFASEPTDLTYAKIQGKLDENIRFVSVYINEFLQLEKQAEITFPISARNYAVKGTLNRLEKDGGLLRMRQSSGNCYACYFNSDGRIGLLKESNGKVTDLTSKQYTFVPMTTTRMKTVMEQVEVMNDGQKKMVNVCKYVPIQVSTIQPVNIALAVHNDQLTLFINGILYLEYKGEGISEGAIAINVVKDGMMEFTGLQVCTIDGTGWTPQQVMSLGYSYKASIKPEFVDVWRLDEPLNTINLMRVVKEQVLVPSTVTKTRKETKQEIRKVPKTVDGKTEYVDETVNVTFDVPYTETQYSTKEVMKLVPEAFALQTTRVTDTLGNPLKMPELVQRLKRGDACLTLASEKLYPAVKYLDKTKPETVLVLIPSSAVQPVTAPPAGATPAVTRPMPATAMPAPLGSGVVAAPPAAVVATPAEPKPTVIQLTGHANPIQTVVYSPDGSQIATADGTFWKPGLFVPKPEIMKIATGSALTNFPEETFARSAQYSADGTLLAGLSGNMGTFHVWDAATGKVKLSNSECKTQIAVLAFSSDGKWITTAGGVPHYRPNASPSPNMPPTGELKIWDAAIGKLRYDLKGHEAPVRLVAFNPDASRLATSDQSNTLRVWDAGSGDELFSIVNDQGVATTALAISEKFVALGITAKDKTSIRLINATNGAPSITIAVPTAKQDGNTIPLEKVVFTADGKRIIVKDNPRRPVDGSGPSDTVWIFDVESGKQLNKIETGVKGGLFDSLRASPDGGYFGLSSVFDSKPMLKVWETATGNLIKSMEGQLTLVAIRNGGQEAFVTRAVEIKQDHPPLSVKIWNASTGALLHKYEIPGNGIASLAYSGDGKRLAAGVSYIDQSQKQSYVGELRVWDSASGQELRSIKGIDGWIMAMALDQEGKRAVTAGGGNTRIWNVDDGKELHSLPRAMRLAFSKDGKRLALGAMSQIMPMTKPASDPKEKATEPPRPIMSYPVVIFDASTGKEWKGIDVQGATALAFTSDGGALYTAGSDGIRRWNVGTGLEEYKIPAAAGHFSFDSHYVMMVSASSRSTYTLRSLATRKAISRLRLSPKVPADAAPVDQNFGMVSTYDARGVPMSLSTDGKKLAYVSLDGKTVFIKDVSSLDAAGNEDIAPEEKAQ